MRLPYVLLLDILYPVISYQSFRSLVILYPVFLVPWFFCPLVIWSHGHFIPILSHGQNIMLHDFLFVMNFMTGCQTIERIMIFKVLLCGN
jgi:hypothetical protein